MLEMTVDSTGEQIPALGARSVTIINTDSLNSIQLSSSPSFSTYMTLSPLSSISLSVVEAVYAQAVEPVVIVVVPGTQPYGPGQVAQVNTTTGSTYDFPVSTAIPYPNTVSFTVFKASKPTTIQYTTGSVAVENSTTASLTFAVTIQTASGYVIDSSTNYGVAANSTATNFSPNPFDNSSIDRSIFSGDSILAVFSASGSGLLVVNNATYPTSLTTVYN